MTIIEQDIFQFLVVFDFGTREEGACKIDFFFAQIIFPPVTPEVGTYKNFLAVKRVDKGKIVYLIL